MHDRFSEIDFSNTEQPTLPLLLPIKGDWQDVFGTVIAEAGAPLENNAGQTSNYVFLENRQLSIVTAPQNAIVSRIVQPQTSDGLATVFLDHGRGLYSVLSGITDLSVETGNGIVTGAVIGKLLAKSESEPASILIWQTILNGVYINPLIISDFPTEK
jgi:hypothetical protein